VSADRIDLDPHGLRVTAVEHDTVVLGVYEQQLAVQLDARAYRIAVAWLDLGQPGGPG